MKRICELTRKYKVFDPSYRGVYTRPTKTLDALDATHAISLYIASFNGTRFDSYVPFIGQTFKFRVQVVTTGEELEIDRKIVHK